MGDLKGAQGVSWAGGMEEWGSVMSSNIFSNGASRRIELLADVQRRLSSSSESLEQVRSYAITMLHYACQAGDVAMVHLVLLLCRGVDVNGRNVWGGTPLHSLCRYGHLKAQALSMREIALMFVMHGADLDLRDNYKKTPQDYAMQNQLFEVADVLSAVAGTPPQTAAQTPLAARPTPLQTPLQTSLQTPLHTSFQTPLQTSLLQPPLQTSLLQTSPPPLPSMGSLPPMTATSLASPSTYEPHSTASAAPATLPPVSPVGTPQSVGETSPTQSLMGTTNSAVPPSMTPSHPVMPPISPPAGSGVHNDDRPASQQQYMDIREFGLDPGETEAELEAKRKSKKKNNTIMRHVTMISDAPKQPYGPGRPISRPGSRPQSAKGGKKTTN